MEKSSNHHTISQLQVNKKKDAALSIIYILSTLGDLAYSILLTGCILYGTQLGGTQTDTGLIGAGYGVTYLIMPAILGKLSDKFSRRTSLLIASVCQISIALFYITLGSSILLLIIGQILLGIAYGFYWPNMEAIISEKTGSSPKTHQKGIANFCIAWSIGYMIGPLISGVISDYQVTIVFLIAFLIYLTMFLLIFFGVSNPRKLQNPMGKEESHESLKRDILSTVNSMKEVKTVQSPKKTKNVIMIRILFGMIIYAMVAKIILTYFTDYAVRDDLLNWDGTLTGQVIFIFGIGRTVYFLLSRFVNGPLFRSSITKINTSFLFISGFLLLIIINDSPIVISLIFLIFGFFIGLIYVSSLDLLIVHEKEKGAKAGLFESTIGLGAMLSPFIAGVLGQFLAFLPFVVFSILVLILFFINLFLKSKDAENNNKNL
jgi:DHA1 family tetracycline resistance protein-like MFS transporter